MLWKLNDGNYFLPIKESISHEHVPTSQFLRQLTESQDRGISMCVGSRMIRDARGVLDQIRNIHNSTVPVSIIHCRELTLEDSTFIHADFANVQFIDICQHGTRFGKHHSDMRKRLRSWFCKAAAVILSPFDEVMVMDLDTIWIENPDTVFEYPRYRRTGALYMRDRMTYDRPGRGFQRDIVNFIQTINVNLTLSEEYAKKKVSKDGINLFWRAFLDPDLPTYNSFQDSSMFIIQKSKHPRLLAVFEEILPHFGLGWGDKEMYWIASIIAEESYSFEPFLFSLYGRCGVIMHYHPNDYHSPGRARPLYINAEYLVEKISSIGHGK
jgi:hypothetical protein